MPDEREADQNLRARAAKIEAEQSRKAGRPGRLLCRSLALFLLWPSACASEDPAPAVRSNLSILYSAIAPREAPEIVSRYFTPLDYARVDSQPPGIELPRSRLYALPTSLREEWAGYPGVRHWVDEGCGPETPRLIIYDLEFRTLSPPDEQEDFVGATERAAEMVASTGCHSFGIAPGATPLFGLDAQTCTYDLERGLYRDMPWRQIDLLDIQAQRLVGDHCADRDGLDTYVRLIEELGSYAREQNAGIEVFAQVSFRDTPPDRMVEAIGLVSNDIDGIYFSYPSTHETIPCDYCSPENLKTFLSALNPE